MFLASPEVKIVIELKQSWYLPLIAGWNSKKTRMIRKQSIHMSIILLAYLHYIMHIKESVSNRIGVQTEQRLAKKSLILILLSSVAFKLTVETL